MRRKEQPRQFNTKNLYQVHKVSVGIGSYHIEDYYLGWQAWEAFIGKFRDYQVSCPSYTRIWLEYIK